MDNLVLTGVSGSIEDCINFFIDHITKHDNIKVKETIVADSTTQDSGSYLKNYNYILSVNDMKNRFFSISFNVLSSLCYTCSFRIVENNADNYIIKHSLDLSYVLDRIEGTTNWIFSENILRICSKNNKLLYVGSSKLNNYRGYSFEYDEDNKSYIILAIDENNFNIFTDILNTDGIGNVTVNGQSWFKYENHCIIENVMYLYGGVFFKSKLFYQVTLPNTTSSSMVDCIVDGKKYLRVNNILIDCY